MKLKFTKDEKGEILLSVDGKPFDTEHYLDIVKHVKKNETIELEDFDDNLSQEEQDSINRMIQDINAIKFDEDPIDQEAELESEEGDSSNSDDELPF